MQVVGHKSRLWLGGLVVLVACSWGRFIATGSPKVDESYPSGVAGVALLAGLVVGWGLLVVGWRGFLVADGREGPPRALAYAGLLVAGLMLPMLSNDVFSVFAYGSLAAQGRDVYTTAAGLGETVWAPWVGQHWSLKVCVYGPSTLVAALPVALAGHSPWAGLALLRIVWFAPLALVMEASFRVLRDRPLFHAMVWLNPLWIVEGPGQLHGDLLGVAAVVAGLVLVSRGKRLGGGVLYALAAIGKYSFALAGTWFWLFGARTTRERLVRIPVLAATVVGVGALLYAPFWHGMATLTEPVHALSGMNPGGSIVEVVGILVGLATGHGVPHQDAPVQAALEASRAANAATWAATSLVLRVVFLAVAARLFAGMVRGKHDDGKVALGTGALLVAFLTLASHRFQSWYLVAALPFFGLRCTAAWQRWWTLVVPFAVATEFIHVLPAESPVLPVWSAVTNGAVVVLFLAWPKARYVDLFSPAAAPAPLEHVPEGGQEGDGGQQARDLAHHRDGAQAADGPVV